MTRTDIIIHIVLPQTKTLATLLRLKDANNTGTDDLSADLIDFVVDFVQAGQLGLPSPSLPESLAKALKLQPLTEEVEAEAESPIVSSAK